MKLPTLAIDEIATLQLALALLKTKGSATTVDALSNKLNRYEAALVDSQRMDIVLCTTIKDIGFADDPLGVDIPKEHHCNYSLNIEASSHSNTYYFSLYNEDLDKVTNETSLTGLFGAIEIRAGKPTISIGMRPDENDIHIASNNSSQLTIIPENERGYRSWEPVLLQKHETQGLVFQADLPEVLLEQRQALASLSFADHDFGSLIVSDDGNWDIDDTKWSKAVFFEQENMTTMKGTFSLVFAPDSSYIISATHST